MFIILFIFWIIINGSLSPETIITGMLVTALLYVFLSRVLDYTLKKDLLVWRCLGKLMGYGAFLLLEIIKSSLAVSHMIITFQEPDPVIIRFRTGLKTNTGKVLLANSITLTPSTITVDQKGDEFIIHGLDRRFTDGIEESTMVKRAEELEAYFLKAGGLMK